MEGINRRTLLVGALAAPAVGLAFPAFADSGELTLSHYFTGDLGLKSFNEQLGKIHEGDRDRHQEQSGRP